MKEGVKDGRRRAKTSVTVWGLGGLGDGVGGWERENSECEM